VSLSASSLVQRIRHQPSRVSVVGPGCVGMALSRDFARAGLPVIGLDVDKRHVALPRSGTSAIIDIAHQASPGVAAHGD